jgi:hypothetical protein
LKLAPEQPHVPNRASGDAVRAFVGEIIGEPVPAPDVPDPQDSPSKGCGRPVAWQEAQKSMSALIARGRTLAQAKKWSPRCDPCAQRLFGQTKAEADEAGLARGPGAGCGQAQPRVARAKVSSVTRGVSRRRSAGSCRRCRSWRGGNSV